MYSPDIECRLDETFKECIKTKKIKAKEFIGVASRLLAYLPEDEVESYLFFFFGKDVMTMFAETMKVEDKV